MKNDKKQELPKTENVINDENDLHNYLESLEGKKNYSDFPELKKNPFLCLLNDELSIKLTKIGSNGNVTTSISNHIDESTGEISEVISIEGGTAFYKKKIVDDNNYIKVFKKNLKEMFELSNSALKLFHYFMEQMDFKDREGMIYMSLEDAIAFCEYEESSRPLIYKGLTELILKGFICKTNRPWTFYLNPKYAHNGDRVLMFQEYVKKSSIVKNTPRELPEDWDKDMPD